jgi:hypothetical protein
LCKCCFAISATYGQKPNEPVQRNQKMNDQEAEAIVKSVAHQLGHHYFVIIVQEEGKARLLGETCHKACLVSLLLKLAGDLIASPEEPKRES